jgi:hypothetical protein
MGGWVGGGMDINIYIACLRQLVAFAPKVIIGNNYRRYGRMGGQRERARGGVGLPLLSSEAKNKRGKLRCLFNSALLCRKKNFLYIFMM